MGRIVQRTAQMHGKTAYLDPGLSIRRQLQLSSAVKELSFDRSRLSSGRRTGRFVGLLDVASVVVLRMCGAMDDW